MTILSDDELRSVLRKVKWDSIKDKSPEFIISVIQLQFKKSGIVVSVEKHKKITVEPVTVNDNELVEHHNLYVYENFRGWKGVVLKERHANGTELCIVKISKDGHYFVTTEILKKDLRYG